MASPEQFSELLGFVDISFSITRHPDLQVDTKVEQEIHEIHEIKIGQVLGRGNFAVVCKVKGGSSIAEGRLAAKIMKRANIDSMDMQVREAKMLALVAGSQHVMPLHGLFSAKVSLNKSDGADLSPSTDKECHLQYSTDMILLEQCHCSYGDHLKQTGKEDEASAGVVMLQVFSALRHIHGLGVVHRDVKASNILLAFDGRAVLSDFGMAVAPEIEDTGMHWKCGTPGYVAPEVIMSHAGSSKVDVFAAGVILYLALSGRLPFDSRGDWMRQTTCRKLKLESEIVGSSPAARELLEGLLDKSPQSRHSAADGVRCHWLSERRISLRLSERITSEGGFTAKYRTSGTVRRASISMLQLLAEHKRRQAAERGDSKDKPKRSVSKSVTEAVASIASTGRSACLCSESRRAA